MNFQAPDSLTEQVAHHLGEKIITGELKPGDRIQEVKFAKELGVSRGSIREAFLILESRYLINIVPRKGAIVSEMSEKQVEDIYEAMVVLLTKLCSKATVVWTEPDLPPYLDLLERMAKYVNDKKVVEYYEASFEFYRLGFRFMNNRYLEDVLENLLPTIRRTYYLALQYAEEELQASLDFFNQLFGVIVQREIDKVAPILAGFGQHQCEIVLKAMKPRAL